jgi:hypothetical protein
VAPLGLSKVATNPWLPGSDVDPLVLLAWILVLFAPLAAGLVARRRYTRSGGTAAPAAAARQIMAAGLVTNLVGSLLAAALGTGTIALMLKGAWLRNWLYHGQHQFFGIAGLRSLLDGNLTAIAYSHELTASVDSSIFLVMCVAFPLFALALTGMAALGALGNAAAEQDGDPPRGGGGPPAPKAVPDGPGGAQLATLTRHDAGPGPRPRPARQERRPAATTPKQAPPLRARLARSEGSATTCALPLAADCHWRVRGSWHDRVSSDEPDGGNLGLPRGAGARAAGCGDVGLGVVVGGPGAG